MKSFKIIYKNNKFYEEESGKRLYPHDNTQYILAGDDTNFGTEDPLNLPHKKINSAEEQLIELEKITNIKDKVKILSAGDKLEFNFKLTKRKDFEDFEYSFGLVLLEDLYLYNCISWQSEKLPELLDCKCMVDKNISKNVDFFEPIYADSLNEVYTKTRQFYFPNQGTPGGSVYQKFKILNTNFKLADIRKDHLQFFKNKNHNK